MESRLIPGPVIALLRDGTHVPCEIYQDRVESTHGVLITVWKVTARFDRDDFEALRIVTLPARSMIEVEFA